MTNSSGAAGTASSIASSGLERLGGAALGTVTPVTEPSVSIIITNHNYAAFVGTAINSPLAQHDSGIDVEVIGCDDVATDCSLAIIDGFANRMTRLATPNS